MSVVDIYNMTFELPEVKVIVTRNKSPIFLWLQSYELCPLFLSLHDELN
jgi:hypothetical protein